MSLLAASRSGLPDAEGPLPVGGVGAVEFTCPMHPQLRRRGPGPCPVCGMALEPALAAARTGENLELRDKARRF